MPRFAANLSLLFTEVDFIDRFAAAARAGFRAVECQFPYAETADRIAEQLRQHDLQMVLHNLPAGDWAAGERGIACHPDRIAEFRRGVAQAIDRWGCGTELYLCGGGVENRALVDRLQAALPGRRIHSTELLGLPPQWVEAATFAWLARQRLLGRPGNLPSVTGARRPVMLGGVYLPDD